MRRELSAVVPQSFRTRSRIVRVGNGMEGNGREEEGNKTRGARHASLSRFVTRETGSKR